MLSSYIKIKLELYRSDVAVQICIYVSFSTLYADSSAKSHVNVAAKLDDVPHEYEEVQEVDVRDTGNVMKGSATPPFSTK